MKITGDDVILILISIQLLRFLISFNINKFIFIK